MSDLTKYFGQDGLFAQACNMVRDQQIPLRIREHAESLGKSYVAYCLGWAFASVVKKKGFSITPGELEEISENKVTWGKPQEFINGFNEWAE